MLPSNFMQQLRDILVGGTGLLRDKVVPLNAIMGADGAPLDAIGEGGFGFAAVETNGLAVQWAATDTTEIALIVHVPEDYDQEDDTLKLRLLAQMGGGDDTPALTAEAYRKRPGEALSADLAPENSGALSDAAAWVEINLSGNELQGGDVVQVFITPAAHANDAINVYGAALRYKTCFVAYDHDDRV